MLVNNFPILGVNYTFKILVIFFSFQMHYYILEDITDETSFANINASGLVLKFHIAIEIVSFSSPQCSIGLRSRKTLPETDIGTKSQFLHFAKCKCMVNTSIYFALFNYILGIWWVIFHDK